MQSDHPEKVLRFAIGAIGAIQQYNANHGSSVNIRYVYCKFDENFNKFYEELVYIREVL